MIQEIQTDFTLMGTTPFAPELEGPERETSRRRSRLSAILKGPVEAVRGYIKSYDCLELICCFLFNKLCRSLIPILFDVHERPIPYQTSNDGEILLNLAYAEELPGHSTVTSLMLRVSSGIIPLILQVILAIFYGDIGDVHGTLCTYKVSLGLTVSLTDFIKRYCGYLRPSFYVWCDPDFETEECGNDGADGRKSFLSGHASYSSCGLTVLSLYLLRLFGSHSELRRATVVSREEFVNDGSGGCLSRRKMVEVRYPATKKIRTKRFLSLLCLGPVFLALFIGISRIRDNKHFPADVVGGTLLGAATACACHGLWFPSVPLG